MKKIFLAAMSLLAISSCTKSVHDIDEPVNPNGRLITVGVSTPDGGASTRASLTDNGSSWTVQWNKGDALGGWQSGTAVSKFEMGAFADEAGKKAEFSGTAATGSLRLVYPFEDATLATAGQYLLDMQYQSVDMGAPLHRLSKKMYMVSDKLTISTDNTVPTFRMQAVNAVLQIKSTFSGLEEANSYRIVRVEVGGADGGCIEYPVRGTLDLTTDGVSITSDATGGVLVASVENSPEVTNGEYTINVASLPFEMVASDKLQVKVIMEQTVKNSGVTSYVAYTKAVEATSSYNFERGKYHWVKLTGGTLAAYTPTNGWLGTGTESDPYLISGVADLQLLATNVSRETDPITYEGKYFRMTRDIDLSSVCGLTAGEGGTEKSWNPIGYFKNTNPNTIRPFLGNFDGGDYAISNLYINQTNSSIRGGLFAVIGVKGQNVGAVKNLVVSGAVTYKEMCGGIAFQNFGTVSNCSFAGSIESTQAQAGGIVAQNDGVISDCVNSATVKAKQTSGGVVASNYGAIIINCSNSGNITAGNDHAIKSGGVVAYSTNTQNRSKVINCYNTGTITGGTGTSGGAGGVFGFASSSGTDVINCYSATTDVNGTAEYKYYTTSIDAISNTYKDLTSMQLASFATTLNNSATTYNTTNTLKACGWYGGEGVLPRLQFGSDPTSVTDPSSDNWINHASPNFGGGTGEQNNPYLITSAYELAHLAEMTNTKRGDNWSSGKHFRLTGNIDLTGKEWTAIGNYSNQFNGTFDGAGHKVTGLYINKPDVNDQGLFGCVDTDGTVKNLGVDGSVKGKNGVAGVAGSNYGAMTNCYNTGSVSGTGTESKYVGGVAGRNNGGTLTNNYYLKDCASANSTIQGGVGDADNKVIADVNDQFVNKLEAEMKAAQFAEDLNTNAAAYNNNPEVLIKACKWKDNSTTTYPTLLFGTVAVEAQ